MRVRPVRILLAAALVLAGCGPDQAGQPAAVRFTEVALPGGAQPLVLTPVGDSLLIGVRREGQPVVPGLLRRGADGELAEITVNAAEMYGRLAYWYSVASDGERIVAVGGKTGGAHGNVRWTVWTGSDAGVAEKPQPFTTFGGYGGGALIGAVLTPAGPALVGTWQSPTVGQDIMVWQPDGNYWARQPPAGTALENKRESLKFPLAATGVDQGILIAGWELSGGRQHAAVWRSASGDSGWTMTRLPGAGRGAAAVAARCSDGGCEVAGRVDGKLALWRFAGGEWTRVDGVAPVAVAYNAEMAAPVDVEGRPAEVLNDGDRVVLAGESARAVDGPTGRVVAAARVGGTLYVAAGGRLWQAEISA